MGKDEVAIRIVWRNGSEDGLIVVKGDRLIDYVSSMEKAREVSEKAKSESF